MRRTIRIGSRESALAVAQAKLVIDAVQAAHPELDIALITMKTTGDINMKPFADATDQFGIKGLFTRELEQALADGRLDFVVHSLKDMPLVVNEQLPIVALAARGESRDALVLPDGGVGEPGKPVGCSSTRRRLQFNSLDFGDEISPVRGNVLTRLKKLDDGEYSALILAAAGLCRLGLDGRISRLFNVDEMIPAAGQGILACQGRCGEDYGYLQTVKNAESEICAAAERSFAAALGGGCTSPVAAYAEVKNGRVFLRGFYADEERGFCRRGVLEGGATDAALLGERLARRLKEDEKP